MSSSSSPPSPSSSPTRAPMEDGQSRLLTLPRELRDQIYREYILTDTEGYTYDFEAGKLRTADGSPIDLNLMYTCRLVAAEMAGLALKLQTITFSTIYSEDLRFRARYWAGILYWGLYDESDLESFAPRMPDEAADEVARRYSGTYFYHIFDRLRTRNLDIYGDAEYESFGYAPSVFRRMTHDVMELALTNASIYKELVEENVDDSPDHRHEKCDPTVRLGLGQSLWRIPTVSELDALAEPCTGAPRHYERSFRERFLIGGDFEWDDEYPGMCRFSAAAAAIHFLNSHPNCRPQLRNIVLVEDRESVSRPECHAHGLIPFCSENPNLRIERRISLWRNLLLTCADSFHMNRDRDPVTTMRHNVQRRQAQLQADNVTRRIAEYMAEASVPEMPAAITLVFDGDPLPELSSRIFRETVQRDAAWQTAFDRAFTTQRGWLGCEKRFMRPYQFDGFPDLLRAMSLQHKAEQEGERVQLLEQQQNQGVTGRCRRRSPTPTPCRIRCNFDPGEAWDEARISAEIEEQNRRRGVNTLDEWLEAWSSTRPTKEYQTEPPLAEYHLLFDELVIPFPKAIGN